jgi:hypothetical protein
MKNIYLIIILLAGLTFSCMPDMDLVNPNEITTESYYQNETELIAGVNGAYNILQRSGGWGTLYVFMPSMAKAMILFTRLKLRLV